MNFKRIKTFGIEVYAIKKKNPHFVIIYNQNVILHDDKLIKCHLKVYKNYFVSTQTTFLS